MSLGKGEDRIVMGKKPVTTVDMAETTCCAKGCKTRHTRFNFCNEHFEQFKFGLIKKDGHPVPDYEKKLSQYQDFQAKTFKKVA